MSAARPSLLRQAIEENQMRRAVLSPVVRRISDGDKRRRLLDKLSRAVRKTHAITEQLKELEVL